MAKLTQLCKTATEHLKEIQIALFSNPQSNREILNKIKGLKKALTEVQKTLQDVASGLVLHGNSKPVEIDQDIWSSFEAVCHAIYGDITTSIDSVKQSPNAIKIKECCQPLLDILHTFPFMHQNVSFGVRKRT
jgi:Mg2+ and Co2+ transporter CorA